MYELTICGSLPITVPWWLSAIVESRMSGAPVKASPVTSEPIIRAAPLIWTDPQAFDPRPMKADSGISRCHVVGQTIPPPFGHGCGLLLKATADPASAAAIIIVSRFMVFLP